MGRLAVAISPLLFACSTTGAEWHEVGVAPPSSACPARELDSEPATLSAAIPPPRASGVSATEEPPAEAAVDPPLLTALPTISDDRRRIAVWAHYADGARGEASSELLVLATADDSVVARVKIDDPDAELSGDDRPRRLAAADALLAREHWTRLVPLDVTQDATAAVREQGLGQSIPQVATNARLSVRFHEPVLMVDLDAKRALTRRFPAWSDRASRACQECIACPAALADLSQAWADAEARAALVVIQYGGGTDLCWEPDERYHAIRF